METYSLCDAIDCWLSNSWFSNSLLPCSAVSVFEIYIHPIFFLQEKAGYESTCGTSSTNAKDSKVTLTCGTRVDDNCTDDIGEESSVFSPPPSLELCNQELFTCSKEQSSHKGKGFLAEMEGSKGVKDAERMLGSHMLSVTGNSVADKADALAKSAKDKIYVSYILSRSPSPDPSNKDFFACKEQSVHQGKGWATVMDSSMVDKDIERIFPRFGNSSADKADIVVKTERMNDVIKTQNLNMNPSSTSGFVMYPPQTLSWGARQDPPMVCSPDSGGSALVKTEKLDLYAAECSKVPFSKDTPTASRSVVLDLFKSGQVPTANITKSVMGAGGLLVGSSPSSQIDINALDVNALLDGASQNAVVKDLVPFSNELGRIQQRMCAVFVSASISRSENMLVARVMEDGSRFPEHVVVEVSKGLTAFNTDIRESFGGKPGNCGVWDSTSKSFKFFMATLAALRKFLKDVYSTADKHGRSVHLDQSVERIMKEWIPDSPRLSGFVRVDYCTSRLGTSYLKMDGAVDCLRSLVMAGDDEARSTYLIPSGSVLVSGYNSLHRVDGFKASELKAALHLFQMFEIRVCSSNFDILKGPEEFMLRRVE